MHVEDPNADYYLTEGIIPGFVSDIPVNPGYIIVQGGEAHVTNTSLTQTGSLAVKKMVEGPVTDERFGFTLTLEGEKIPEGV